MVGGSKKTILITGCSSGIGLDCALRLQKEGWQVFATCRNQDDVQRLSEDYGLTSLRLDYEDTTSIDEAVSVILEQTGGRLDALFNNGAYAVPAAVEDLPVAALRANFEANFFGWHHLTCQIIPVMRAQGSGRIIQNSSVLGFAALRYRGSYNATKFALEGLTDTMRLELYGSGIDVVLIEPGPIRTMIREKSYPQFLKWITVKGSAHEGLYRKALIPRLTAVNPPPDRFELGPEAVTEAVLHALNAKKPKIRYRITTATTLMMLAKRLFSSPMMDRLSRRI